MTAVFGIDAQNIKSFLNRNAVCLNNTREKEKNVLNTFLNIRTEDIVFIKTFTPQAGLTIRAVGLVLSSYPTKSGMIVCTPIKWVWYGTKFIEHLDESCPNGDDFFYEEYNIAVQKEIINLMPNNLQLPNMR